MTLDAQLGSSSAFGFREKRASRASLLVKADAMMPPRSGDGHIACPACDWAARRLPRIDPGTGADEGLEEDSVSSRRSTMRSTFICV